MQKESTATSIAAAGGITLSNLDKILLIKRLNKWDFPKGKIEKGESIEIAALREVEEETGLTSLEIIKSLGVTNHTYEMNGVLYEKTTHWFLMKGMEECTVIPQIEEGITEVCWVSMVEVEEYLKESYDTLKLLWRRVKEFMK